MELRIGIQVLEAALFGAVFSALFFLIQGWGGWRPWGAKAVVLAGLAYLILFGAISV